MKTNYIGYIKLQKTSQKQFLYTTSSGGGFFNIYVNFDVVDNIIKNISLFIKNYKGTKYYFKEKYLEITKSHDSALRIAAALTKYGSGRSIKSKNEFQLNIAIKDITNVFFTRDESHFNIIESCSNQELVNIANNPISIDIPENVIDSQRYADTLKFKIAKNSLELFDLQTELEYEDYLTSEEELNNIKNIRSIGNNCRVSYLDVVD